MSIKHKKTLKMSALGITTLAASSVWGKSPLNAEAVLGVDYLILDEMPLKHVEMCLPQELFANGVMIPSNIAVVIDSDTLPTTFEMSFTISEMIDTEEDRVLYLIYGTRPSPSPEIKTHPNGPVLGIALSELEILGVYQIPKVISGPQSVSIGLARPFAASKMTVNVEFYEHEISQLVTNNKKAIYVQAGLIRTSELEQGIFENMILSEMDTIALEPNECPVSIKADNSGDLCKSPSADPDCN